MNRGAAVGVAVAAFLAGLLIGVFAGRRGPPEQQTPRPAAAPPSEPSPAPPSADPNADVPRLRARVRELEERLSRTPLSEDDSRIAAEIHAGLSSRNIQQDAKEFMKLVGRLAELRPTMTDLFVRKYRDARPKMDTVALELAIASGGPEATALLKEIFGSPATSKGERIAAGIALAGDGLLSRTAGTVPADPELLDLASRTLALPEAFERQGGAGLLGLQDTDPSRALLQTLAVQDKDDQVRIAALRALSRVGNRSTLEYLYSYASSSFPKDPDPEKLTPAARMLLQTLETLVRKYGE